VLQACVKLAYDLYKPENFSLYIDSWREIATKVTVDNAKDYMAVPTVL